MTWKKITANKDAGESIRTAHVSDNDEPHQYLYHVTDASLHDSIKQRGLMTRPDSGRSYLSAIWAFEAPEKAHEFVEQMRKAPMGQRFDGPLHIWKIDASHYPQQHDWWWRELEGKGNPSAHIIENPNSLEIRKRLQDDPNDEMHKLIVQRGIEQPLIEQVVKPEHLELFGAIPARSDERK